MEANSDHQLVRLATNLLEREEKAANVWDIHSEMSELEELQEP